MKPIQCHISTPIGIMIARTDGNAIVSLDFTEETERSEVSQHPLLLELESQLHEYFARERSVFTLPLAPRGTPFQQKVWNTLIAIPYGQTITYAEEAIRIGNPKATRAVAGANGKNPIAIVIPCHRVIASGGGLGGYSGGLWRKEFLLELEHTSSAQNAKDILDIVTPVNRSVETC